MKVCIYRSEKVYTLIYFCVLFVTLIFFFPTVQLCCLLPGFVRTKILGETAEDVYVANTHFTDRQECVRDTGHRVR